MSVFKSWGIMKLVCIVIFLNHLHWLEIASVDQIVQCTRFSCLRYSPCKQVHTQTDRRRVIHKQLAHVSIVLMCLMCWSQLAIIINRVHNYE